MVEENGAPAQAHRARVGDAHHARFQMPHVIVGRKGTFQAAPTRRSDRHKRTRRAHFLAEMEITVPWSELDALIQPLYGRAALELGLPSIPGRMLRAYLLQSWFGLSDAALEDALCDSEALRAFCGMDAESVPDETAFGAFRNLLERHRIGRRVIDSVQKEMARKGLEIAPGTLVDPLIGSAQSSARAKAAERSEHEVAVRPTSSSGTAGEASAVEQALYERESQLHTFISLAPVAIAMFDRQMRYLAVSRQCAEDCGAEPADLIGRCVYEVFPHFPERWKAAHERALAGVTERSDADLLVLEDGASQWVRWEIRPWFKADQSVGGLLLFSEIITQRKEAERRLMESEARLELATRAASLGIYDYNVTDGITTWDARVRGFFGVGPTETINFDTFLAGLHPEDRGATLAALEESLGPNSDGRHTAEYRVIDRAGSIRWLSSNGTVFFEDGRAVRLIGTVQDVTERKQAALALAASERRFRHLTEAIPQLVWTCDDLGRIEYVSAQWTQYTGQSAAQACGYGWEDVLHEEDRDAVRSRLRDAVARASTFDAEARLRGADGQYRWFKQRAVPVRGDGPVERWFGTSTDITDLVNARESLSTLADELRQADHRKDAFLATLSHELRNPLAPIRTAAQILMSPKLTEEQLSWARQVIQRQVTHMALLLNDLLEVTRITRGKLVLKKQRVALTGIVDSAVEAARPLLEAKHHHLSLSLPQHEPQLEADPLRLSQVLSNLLTNAAKYTDPGGQIELAARVEGATLCLSVMDNGVGIPQEALGRIFGMFWQLEGADGRCEGGLGIGLAFVKGLVELHGGTIEARSEGPGKGSQFLVRLPMAAERPIEPTAPAENEATGTAVRRRVLVADDNKDAADSLAMLLRLAGHEVRVAHGGRAALSVAGGFRPEVAVLDIGMPDLDGYAVARALRQESCVRAKPMCLIALTGWGQEEDKQRARDVGFDHHLTKPVNPETLEALLLAK